jgi:hypothetical protein
MEVQADGSVLLASERLVLDRVAVGGEPLPDFGLFGRTRIGLAALSDQMTARDVRVQPDGRIVALVSDRFTGAGGALVRFSPAGALEGAIQWHGGADGPFAARTGDRPRRRIPRGRPLDPGAAAGHRGQ